MTARVHAMSAAILRAALVAAVLAIMAGILGMHVMTANHSSHAGHAGTVTAPAAHGAGGQSAGDTVVGHSHAGHTAGHTAVVLSDGVLSDGGDRTATGSLPGTGASFTASESCGSGCPDAREAGASCIPMGKTGSLSAVPPPAGLATHVEPGMHTRAATSYSYVPSGPTPCELSISRT